MYFIYGEENYLVKTKVNELIQEFQKNIEGLEIIKFQDTNTDILKVIDQANTVSLFGDKKLIVIDNFDYPTTETKVKWKPEKIEKFISFIQNNESSIFICSSYKGKLDTKKEITKLIQKEWTVIKYDFLNDDEIFKYIKKYSEKLNIKISDVDLKEFQKNMPNSIFVLKNELEKLSLQPKINQETIKDWLADYGNETVFDLVENIVNKNKKKTFEILKKLNKYNENTITMIFLLSNSILTLKKIKILSKTKNIDFISNKLKMNKYKVEKLILLSNKYDKIEIDNFINSLHTLDQNIKYKNIDPNLAFNLMLLEKL